MLASMPVTLHGRYRRRMIEPGPAGLDRETGGHLEAMALAGVDCYTDPD
jgi:hypothetical protein